MASDVVIRAAQAVMLILMWLQLTVGFAPVDFSSSLLSRYSTAIITRHHKISGFVKDDDSSYENEGDTDAGGDPINKSKKQYTVARAGGRRPRSHKQTNIPKTKNNGNDNIFALFRQWALPLLCLIAILRLFFGMFGSTNSNPNENVVYYSRSVYQSTTYTQDGNVETKRRESFQSNVPSLVEKYGNDGTDIAIGDDLDDRIDNMLFGKW